MALRAESCFSSVATGQNNFSMWSEIRAQRFGWRNRVRTGRGAVSPWRLVSELKSRMKIRDQKHEFAFSLYKTQYHCNVIDN